jgi:tripeptidyl-peptidase-1
VAEFLGQYYSPSDLSSFFYQMGLTDLSSTVTVIGPNNASLPGGEATLDIEFLMGIAPNAQTTFWSLGELHDGQEPFLDWITDVLNADQRKYYYILSNLL